MTSHDITERVILIKLVYAVVYHGVADREAYGPILNQLQGAIDDELGALNRFQRPTVTRHANAAVESILSPFIEAGESCAKFALAIFYLIQELMDLGIYDIRTNPSFDAAFSDVIAEGGTVVDLHNVDRVDRSARKMSRKVMSRINALGYFKTASEIAA